MDLIKIGKYIASKRKQLGLTQKQLADKLNKSDKSVSKWERGICLPDVSVYMELCEALGISINEFLAGEDLRQDELAQKSEDNILQISYKHIGYERILKKTVIALVILMLVVCSLFFGSRIREKRTPAYIEAFQANSVEMKTAEMLSGISSSFLYRYHMNKGNNTLFIYISEYRNGKLVERKEIPLTCETSELPSDGIIAIVQRHPEEILTVICANESVKINLDIPILNNVKDSKELARAVSQVPSGKLFLHEEEINMMAFCYGDKEVISGVIDQNEIQKWINSNPYAYVISCKF